MNRRSQISRILFLFMAIMMMSGSGRGANGTGMAVTISGHLLYEKKDFDKNGFTGTISKKAIRFATVEIVRDSDKKVLNSGLSDAGGNYSVGFTNTGPAGVYVRVQASAPDFQISVKQPPNTLWAIFTSPPINDTSGTTFTQNLTATTTSVGGVFNLLDVMITAAEFVNGLTSGVLPPLTVYWSPGSSDGTYFNPADNSISVLGGCADSSISVLGGCTTGDTDEYDDAVVIHEFGHFAASIYSRDDSSGGIHYLDDNTQDIRLSWSEGWGDFFSSAVRNDPLYIDTVGTMPTAPADLSFNLEDLSTVMGIPLATDAVYTTNEISVAAVLWDILDNDNPPEVYTNTVGTDTVLAGMGPIWDVVAQYLPCTTCGITNVSFEDFWDGWFSCPVCTMTNHGSQAGMETVVADRKMTLIPDSFEPDDTVSNARSITVNGATQFHTLFPAGDTDYISFSARAGTPYTIETLGLTNGADTIIEILDSSGNVMAASQTTVPHTGPGRQD